MTSADALFWNGAIAGSLVLGAAGRVRDRLRSRPPGERRRQADAATAAFLESLGLDPAEARAEGRAAPRDTGTVTVTPTGTPADTTAGSDDGAVPAIHSARELQPSSPHP